jgi:hypothetical protein
MLLVIFILAGVRAQSLLPSVSAVGARDAYAFVNASATGQALPLSGILSQSFTSQPVTAAQIVVRGDSCLSSTPTLTLPATPAELGFFFDQGASTISLAGNLPFESFQQLIQDIKVNLPSSEGCSGVNGSIAAVEAWFYSDPWLSPQLPSCAGSSGNDRLDLVLLLDSSVFDQSVWNAVTLFVASVLNELVVGAQDTRFVCFMRRACFHPLVWPSLLLETLLVFSLTSTTALMLILLFPSSVELRVRESAPTSSQR